GDPLIRQVRALPNRLSRMDHMDHHRKLHDVDTRFRNRINRLWQLCVSFFVTANNQQQEKETKGMIGYFSQLHFQPYGRVPNCVLRISEDQSQMVSLISTGLALLRLSPGLHTVSEMSFLSVYISYISVSNIHTGCFFT